MQKRTVDVVDVVVTHALAHLRELCLTLGALRLMTRIQFRTTRKIANFHNVGVTLLGDHAMAEEEIHVVWHVKVTPKVARSRRRRRHSGCAWHKTIPCSEG